MPVRGSYTVTARVTTADHYHIFSCGKDSFRADLLARNAFVLLFQEFHREVNALQIPAGNIKISGNSRTPSENDCMVLAKQVIDANIHTHVCIAFEGYSFFFHDLEPTIDHRFL